MVIRVTKIAETQSSVIDRHDKIEEQNEGLDEKIKGAVLEQSEIDNRILNIMCLCLSESTEENAELRNAEELTKVKHIINNIPEIPEEDFPLDEAPVRIGKFQENKIRPLKFKARSFESKKHLLQTSRTKFKDRNNGEYKDFF